MIVFSLVFGDLFEFMIKCCVGIKDLGCILLGYGGVLDCIDLLLVVVFIFVVGVYVLKFIGVDL